MRLVGLLLFIISSFTYAGECNIVLGVSQTPYKPYSWIDKDRNAQGMNIELFKALVDKTQCDYEIRVLPWTELLTHFNNGDVTVIVSSLSPFPESHKGTNVLQIPINIAFYGYFYSRQGTPAINNLEDLSGKTALVLEGSVTHDYLKNIKDEYNINILFHPSTESAMAALVSGQGDVGIFSLTAAINILEEEQYAGIKVSGKPIFPASYGFLIHKSDMAVFDIMNAAMDELKAEGTYFDIVKKWSASRSNDNVWLKWILIAMGVLVVVFLVVMIWNKTLYEQVQKKTAALNQEIEQRKHAEQENLKLRDEAMIAGKLAVLGEMAGSIIHEINNPTGLIIHNVNFLGRLQRELYELINAQAENLNHYRLCGMSLNDAMAEAEDVLTAIDESLIRITNTINELKDYGKEQHNVFQIIDLTKCLHISVKLTRYFVKNYTRHFNIEIAAGEFPIYGNMLHIEQLIANLIHNACYALTDKEQTITCRLSRENRDDGPYARLAVIDNGCGMDAKTQQRLFTPFFTTRQDSGGTGLGLTIVSRIVKEHHGFIQINSEAGKGTEFAVFLPLDEG